MEYQGFEYVIHEMISATDSLIAEVELDDGSGRIKDHPVIAWATIQFHDPKNSSSTVRRPDIKHLGREELVPMVHVGQECTLAPLIENPTDQHFNKHYKVKRVYRK